jgi:hypothetical protein
MLMPSTPSAYPQVASFRVVSCRQIQRFRSSTRFLRLVRFPAAPQRKRRSGCSAFPIPASRPAVRGVAQPLLHSCWACGKEVLDRRDQEVGLVFRDEGATLGDQLESTLRQQLCQPSSMVAGEDLVILGPQHQRRFVEVGEPLRGLECLLRIDRSQHAPEVAPDLRV